MRAKAFVAPPQAGMLRRRSVKISPVDVSILGVDFRWSLAYISGRRGDSG
jgi:hypothetical protein